MHKTSEGFGEMFGGDSASADIGKNNSSEEVETLRQPGTVTGRSDPHWHEWNLIGFNDCISFGL